MTTRCSLCSPSLTPLVDETALWHVRLNYNQNLLGKQLIVLNRHEEHVASVSTAEWLELHALVQRTTDRLRRSFAPDHFNYVFLQNQDRHVHMHVIPRYAVPREFSGLVSEDPDYPDHYAVPGRELRVSAEVLETLALMLTTKAHG
jgi:diadenosine tetraphosphate (Ap4A) HIT family hydrolase